MGHQGNNKNKKRAPNNPRSMGREGMKAIRNIAFGNFNFYTEGQIFRDQTFTMATLEEVDQILLETSIHISAISYAYPGTNDTNILSLLRRDKRKYEAYQLVKQILGAVVCTGDTGHIWALLTRLPDYRYDI